MLNMGFYDNNSEYPDEMPRLVIVLYYYYFYEIIISVRYSIFLLDLRMIYYGRGFELSGRINVNSVHIIVREIC